MKDTYNLSEFRSFTRVRQIVGGVTLLFALTLAGPPRLWGDCPFNGTGPSGLSVTVSPGSVVGGDGTILTATLTINKAVTTYYYMELSAAAAGVTSQIIDGLDSNGWATIGCGYASTTVQFQVGSVSQPTTATFGSMMWGPNGSRVNATAGPFNRRGPLRWRHSARSKRRTLERAVGAVE